VKQKTNGETPVQPLGLKAVGKEKAPENAQVHGLENES
jgi:hypothetical protein